MSPRTAMAGQLTRVTPFNEDVSIDTGSAGGSPQCGKQREDMRR